MIWAISLLRSSPNVVCFFFSSLPMLSLKTNLGDVPAYCLEIIANSNFLYFAHRSSQCLVVGIFEIVIS